MKVGFLSIDRSTVDEVGRRRYGVALAVQLEVFRNGGKPVFIRGVKRVGVAFYNYNVMLFP